MKIFWKEIIDDRVLWQLENCLIDGAIGVLTADAHYGYSMPVWWCIAYPNHVSLSWVGFDIWCGNKAVKTNIKYSDIDRVSLIKEINKVIWFGVWRPNPNPIEHEVLEKIKHSDFLPQRSLYQLACSQLWTIGSWNHYVDIFRDEDDYIWVWVHFWSRGFWHKTTMWFIALSQWLWFDDKANEWAMDAKPILFDMDTELWQAYFYAMSLAGEYAYAGRDRVCQTIVDIMWWSIEYEVHNHHNFARKENHFGQDYYVVRKWCTPAFPWQRWFVGANMRDKSVIIEWIDCDDAKQWLYSTVHGAWRVMGRREAAWKTRRQAGKLITMSPWKVDFENTKAMMKYNDILLYGAGADESPECYKSLKEVLSYQWETIKIIHELTPVIVMMAWSDEYDPYKD